MTKRDKTAKWKRLVDRYCSMLMGNDYTSHVAIVDEFPGEPDTCARVIPLDIYDRVYEFHFRSDLECNDSRAEVIALHEVMHAATSVSRDFAMERRYSAFSEAHEEEVSLMARNMVRWIERERAAARKRGRK